MSSLYDDFDTRWDDELFDCEIIDPQPDPRDAVIARLMEAVEAYVNRSDEYRIISTDRGGSHGVTGKAFIAVGDAYNAMIEALAAAKEVMK